MIRFCVLAAFVFCTAKTLHVAQDWLGATCVWLRTAVTCRSDCARLAIQAQNVACLDYLEYRAELAYLNLADLIYSAYVTYLAYITYVTNLAY